MAETEGLIDLGEQAGDKAPEAEQQPAATEAAPPAGDAAPADAAPAGDDAATPQAQRPDWLPEKFWVADKGEANFEGLAKSYAEAQALISKRIGELDDAGRKALLDIARPELESSLKQAMEAERKAAVPERYEIPEGVLPYEVADGDPLLDAVTKVGRERGWTQDDMTALIGAYGEVAKAAQEQQAAEQPDPDKERQAIGPDFQQRHDALKQAVIAVAGLDGAKALLGSVRTAAQFHAAEALVKAMREKPMPGAQPAAEPVDINAKIDELMARPDYYSNAAVQQQVSELFARQYEGTIAPERRI